MKNELPPAIEMRDLADGLWIWRSKIPFDCGNETLILDPQAPPEDAVEVWERLDVCHPTAVVILKPDHVRDTDLLVPRYNPRAFGPRLFFRDGCFRDQQGSD
jgi:hypothetical protein